GAVMEAGVDSDRVAAEGRRRIDPLLVVLHRLVPLLLDLGAQITLIIDHDQNAGDAEILGARLQLLEVRRVMRLVLQELIDKFNALDPELLARDLGEVEVVDLLVLKLSVQRPLGQRDLEVADLPGPWLALRFGVPSRRWCTTHAQQGPTGDRAFQE